MISYSDLKKGARIILDKQPYEITEVSLLFKGRGHSVSQAKLKNLISGSVVSRTFHPSDSFKDAEISELKAKFIYFHRDRYVFEPRSGSAPAEPERGKRFELTGKQIGDITQFLKPNQEVEGLIFEGKIINISLPIKIQLQVAEAPPGLKGERAQAGTKPVVLETGATVNTPLFVKTGDIIEINTETGEYVRRIQ